VKDKQSPKETEMKKQKKREIAAHAERYLLRKKE
jgi:hypothetical protein